MHSPNLSGSSWLPYLFTSRLPNASKKQPRMTAIIINVRKYIDICAVAHVQASPPRHSSKRFVLNLLLSDRELSSCANSPQHVKTRLVTWSRESRERNPKHHLLGFTRVCWETFRNLQLPKWDLWACFLRWWFRNGGLWWRFALAEKTSSFYSLWCGDAESGLACQQCGGVNPQSLCQTREEAENMRNIYMIYSSLICKPEHCRKLYTNRS